MRSTPDRNRETLPGLRGRPRLGAPGSLGFFGLGLTLLALSTAAALPTGQQPSAAKITVATTPDALALVEKMAERVASYPKLESWQARALSTTSRMTSEWKPKSTVRSEKIVSVERRPLVRGDPERDRDGGRPDPRRHREAAGGSPRAGREAAPLDGERAQRRTAPPRSPQPGHRPRRGPPVRSGQAGWLRLHPRGPFHARRYARHRPPIPLTRSLPREVRRPLLRRSGDPRRRQGRADHRQNAGPSQAHGDGGRLRGAARGPPGDEKGRHAHPRRPHRQEYPHRGRRDLQRPRPPLILTSPGPYGRISGMKRTARRLPSRPALAATLSAAALLILSSSPCPPRHRPSRSAAS
ncbi:MAG: hypothetical protein MZU79_06160 [Anaerotruncus sp.]|nr:hypothetical protein [Anaerotruncus sp.]